MENGPNDPTPPCGSPCRRSVGCCWLVTTGKTRSLWTRGGGKVLTNAGSQPSWRASFVSSRARDAHSSLVVSQAEMGDQRPSTRPEGNPPATAVVALGRAGSGSIPRDGRHGPVGVFLDVLRVYGIHRSHMQLQQPLQQW